MEILILELGGRIGHDLGHQSGRAAVAIAAGLEIFDDVIDVPAPQSIAAVVCKLRGKPVLQPVAREPLVVFGGACNVLRGVASAAMPRAFHQVGAPVPFLAFVRFRMEGARLEIHPVPSPHENAVVERPSQLVRGAVVLYRRQRVEVGADSHHVVARELGEIWIRKGREEPFAVRTDSKMQRAIKIFIRPRANASLPVGRDIG